MAGPVVTVKQGSLRGVEIESDVGGSFISFKGIPYAEPPVGNLRFKDPRPPQSWTDVREASKEGPQCMQLDFCFPDEKTDEDCLYLNVATTSLMGSRPVMVWIHGGAFMWGNGGPGLYGPDYLVKRGIVFVSMNYRLGVFGFLSLDHEVIPGNMGLKDQVACLRWVKENIALFGGDPNNVTIFGESAGAASVHYHLLSPLSKGLFHKAIAQSGVALNPWASAFKPVEIAHRLVAYLGKETTDPNEIAQFLRSIAAGDLAKAQQNILTAEEKACLIFPFVPSVDSKSNEPFLSRPVQEVVSASHDVPVLLGYNSHEGIVGLSAFSENVDQNVSSMMFNIFRKLPPSRQSEAVKKMKKFYFREEKVTKDMLNEYIEWISHYMFIHGIHDVVDLRVNTKSPTYLYRFSHHASERLSTILWDNNVKGAGHFDDIAYIFYSNSYRDTPWIVSGSIEQVISDRFLRMWTDFAKTGNPTPQLDALITTKWEPITSTIKNYLAIDSKLLSGVNPDEEDWKFWKYVRNADEAQ